MGERELVKKCQKGDKKAFEELVEQFYPYVSGFLLKTTQNSVLTEDLTQKAFLKMIRSIEKYRSDGASFGTWLIAIAKNCYTDHLLRDGIESKSFPKWSSWIAWKTLWGRRWKK